jgi:hypothetical protein
MLREHINEIMTRWSPKERRGAKYDPMVFLETPEQARKLLIHLRKELKKAAAEKNIALVQEIEEVLETVEKLSKQFFRWEDDIQRSLESQDLREIRKLPLGF